MAHPSSEKTEQLPHDLTTLSDHDLMEMIVGKPTMEEIDRLLDEEEKGPEKSGGSVTMSGV